MRFSIGKNAFTGPFPRWMMLSWNKLKGLDLSWNNFTGTLPTEDHYYLGWANALYLLDLEGNEFNGTVPRGLSMLSNLALLGLADNMFSGTLPEFIGNMTQLLIVSLNNNLFMGRFPEAYSSLSSLRALHIYDNFLTNSLPSSLGNMTSLKSLRVFDNLFSGTLPHSLGDLLSLNILLAHRNILTGTIPASMISCEMMGELKLSYNFFTGYIPSALDKMSNLYSLEVQVNSLSGGWHELDSEFSFLLNLNASVNFFNGNLSFANYLLSVYSIDFSHNLLTGHIDPIGDMVSVYMVFLNDNLLSGNLNHMFRSDIIQYYVAIDLSSNAFTGPFPSQFESDSILTTFAAIQNCFTGTIPTGLCYLEAVQILALDGLSTSKHCRRPTLPNLQYLVPSYLTPEAAIHGTIPACLFSLDFMTTLHLSGNNLHGTIPVDQLGDQLVDLSLSHNELTGTIPPLLRGGNKWVNLDLSFNKLKGDITGGPYENFSSSVSVSLTINRLSGAIPSRYKHLEDVDILRGNIFNCDQNDLSDSSIPQHDPYSKLYSCGSSTTDISLIVWGALVTFITAITLLLIWQQQKHFDPTSSSSTSLRWSGYFARLTIELNHFFNRLLRWYMFYKKKSEISQRNGLIWKESIRNIGHLFEAVRGFTTYVTFFTVVVGSLVYITSSVYYGSYKAQYAWTNSAAYLSGQPAAIILLIYFVLYITVVFLSTKRFSDKVSGVWKTWHGTNKEDDEQLCGDAKFKTQPNAACSSEMEREAGRAHEESTQPSRVIGWNRFNLQGCYRLMVMVLITLFNIIVVVAVNGAYVYSSLNSDRWQVFLSSMALSVFKLWWGNVIQWAIIQFLQMYSPYSANQLERGAADNQSSSRLILMKYVFFFSCLILFNTIVAPWLAALIISSDCFYYVFIKPPSVDTSYSYYSCVEVEVVNCGYYDYVTRYFSYQPPFSYSFQCSSALLVDYAYVFAYKYILIGILYPLLVLAMVWHNDYHQGDGLPTTSTSTNSSRSVVSKLLIPSIWEKNLHSIRSQGSGEGPAVGREEPADVVNQLHLLQRKAGGVDVKREDEDDPVDERKSRSDQDNPTGSDDRVFYAASSREEDDSTKGDTKSADDNDVYFSISLPLLSVAERCSRSFNSGVVFSAGDYAVRLATMIGTLLTFGAVLPYLSLLIALAIFTNTLLVQLGLTQLVESLETMREHGHHGDAARRKLMQTVCQECQHLLEALLLAVRPVFAIAIAFCSFFLLDAEGDDHGAEKGAYFVMALWVFALLCYVGLFHGDWCLEFIQSAPSLLISTLRKNRKKRDEESSVELPPSVPSTSVQEVEEERE
eukprot:scaffold6125_cov262-Ochromonas_danica.AAC.10